MSRILMVAAEMAPFVKTGGLGDVLYALSRALAAAGNDVRVILPRYGTIDGEAFCLRPVASLEVPMGVLGRIPVTVLEGEGTPIAGPGLLHRVRPLLRAGPHIRTRRGRVLGQMDCATRCCRGRLASSPGTRAGGRTSFTSTTAHGRNSRVPQHPVPRRRVDFRAATLLTIHNMLYQGVFDKSLMDVLGIGWEHFHVRELEFFDRVNLLKGGIYHATLINTVSPAYARDSSCSRLSRTGSRASCGTGPPIYSASSTVRTTTSGTPRRTR